MNNIFLNFVSNSLIHENTTKDGKTFYNVSIPSSQSKNGFASFSVNPGQLLNATKRDGTIVDGFKSILLGKPDLERTLSILDSKGKKYTTMKMTNSSIYDSFESSRRDYNSSLVK